MSSQDAGTFVPRGCSTPIQDAQAFHALIAADVDVSQVHVGTTTHLLTLTRSVRDLDGNAGSGGGGRRKYLYHVPLTTYNAGISDKLQQQIPVNIPPTQLPSHILLRLPSPSGDKVVLFCQYHSTAVTATSSNEKLQLFLEIWSHGGTALLRRIPLSSQGHGKLIVDPSGLGQPVWHPDERVLVYLAERRPPDTLDFFANCDTTDNDDDDEDRRGTKATLGLGQTETWGEKYFHQSALLDMFCVNVETGRVGKIRNCPGMEMVTSDGGYTLGQPVFVPGDEESKIVYTAFDAGGGPDMPRRLGLTYCQQRPSQLYVSSIRNLLARLAVPGEVSTKNIPTKDEEDEPFVCLTQSLRLARSPRFSPPNDHSGTSKLVFLGSDRGFVTHSGCLALYAVDWPKAGDTIPVIDDTFEPLVPQVQNPNDSPASCGSVMGLLFPGLFLQSLLEYPFLSSDYLLTTTQWGSSSRIVRISLQTGELRVIHTGQVGHYSDVLLHASLEGGVVFTSSAPNCIPKLWHVPSSVLSESTTIIDSDKMPLPPMYPVAASPFSAIPIAPSLDFTCDIQLLTELPQGKGSQQNVPDNVPVHTILLLPNLTKFPNPPLIVIPHGGPHSVSSTHYVPSLAFLCSHGGYAIALVNYRGSTGFGQDLTEALPGRIGTLDVEDVVAATRKIQQSGLVDPDLIGICGGSHGGFLTGHCCGQYPDLFKVASMRNPVVNLPSMTTATDIPDWCFVEALGSYDWQDYRPPTPDELQLMWEKSPVRYIDRVKAPTLVAIGKKDLRVPPSQGLEWFYTLRARRVPTKLLLYDEDDHALAGTQTAVDHWINIKRWFDEHL
jgi:acylaminoacyl-peptidase